MSALPEGEDQRNGVPVSGPFAKTEFLRLWHVRNAYMPAKYFVREYPIDTLISPFCPPTKHNRTLFGLCTRTACGLFGLQMLLVLLQRNILRICILW